MILQNITFEQDQGIEAHDLFYRGNAVCDKRNKTLYFRKGQEELFNTFFNSLSVKTWKKECGINHVFMKIRGSGKFIVRFGLQKAYKPILWLGDHQVSLEADEACIDMPFWEDLEQGLVFVGVTAISDGEISGGGFFTNEPTRRDIKLGLVITHFNRKKYVIPAVHRICQDVLNDTRYSNIYLVVVDNSKNLTRHELESNDKVYLIPNTNVGGSGGFARGLLYLKDNGFSHCLFMDDDASCHEESIKRTYAYWSYVVDDRSMGISGILFDENFPVTVLEAGGRWSERGGFGVFQKKNAGSIDDLTVMDSLGYSANYGAWCFFSFSVKSISHYPFPFFVRGDDILFSLQNNLKIITLLGVSTWVDSFSNKESVFTQYLSARSQLIISIYAKRASARSWFRLFVSQNRGCVGSYNYALSYATYKAYQDILCKTNLFTEDMTGEKFRGELQDIPAFDHVIPFIEFPQKMLKKRFWMGPMRKISLNCVLLPRFLLGSRAFVKKWQPLTWKLTCFYRDCYCYNNDAGVMTCFRHNKIEIIKSFFRNFCMGVRVFMKFRCCNKKYETQLEKLTTENFWRRYFEKNDR